MCDPGGKRCFYIRDGINRRKASSIIVGRKELTLLVYPPKKKKKNFVRIYFHVNASPVANWPDLTDALSIMLRIQPSLQMTELLTTRSSFYAFFYFNPLPNLRLLIFGLTPFGSLAAL